MTTIKISGIQADGLLAHSSLIGISGRLVVVGKGNHRSGDAEDHRRMNLAVRHPLLVVA